MTNCFDVTNEYDASWTWAAGSAVSSPRELQNYVQTLVEGGLLSENLQHKRLSELHSLAPGTAYGYNILKRGLSSDTMAVSPDSLHPCITARIKTVQSSFISIVWANSTPISFFTAL